MSDPRTNSSTILSEAALASAGTVAPDTPRWIADQEGGTLDASAVVAEGAPPLQGQETEAEFFRKLAIALLDRLFGVRGGGEGWPEDLVSMIAAAAQSLLSVLAGPQATWQAFARAVTRSGDRLSGDTADNLRNRLLDAFDPAGFLRVAQALARTPPDEMDFFGDEEPFDEESFKQAFTEALQQFPESQVPALAIITGPKYGYASATSMVNIPGTVTPSMEDGRRVHAFIQEHYKDTRGKWPLNQSTRLWYTHAATLACSSATLFSTARVTAGA